MEATSLRETLSNVSFENCLEIAVVLGKIQNGSNNKRKDDRAVNLSDEMLAIARRKVAANRRKVAARMIKWCRRHCIRQTF